MNDAINNEKYFFPPESLKNDSKREMCQQTALKHVIK